MITKKIDWSDFKLNIQSRSSKVQYIEKTNSYEVFLFDGSLALETLVHKDGGADQVDFETNYKPTANQTLSDALEIDSDKRQIIRSASTYKGWRYLAHVFEFETSKLNSYFSEDWQANNRCDYTMKFYDDQDNELIAGTQLELDTSCVKTIITIKPSHDYDLIGGNIHQFITPIVDIRLWVVAGVPEFGAAGVKEFVGGLNFRYINAGDHIQTDGRASARLNHTTTGIPYQSNQMQYIVKHPAGHNHKVMVVMEYFRG